MRIRRWSEAHADCILPDAIVPYRPERVIGVVTRLRLDPRAGVVEVTLSDGLASLRAGWPIRRPVLQLRAIPGSGLVLEGVARVDADGELVMADPTFEIVPGPEGAQG